MIEQHFQICMWPDHQALSLDPQFWCPERPLRPATKGVDSISLILMWAGRIRQKDSCVYKSLYLHEFFRKLYAVHGYIYKGMQGRSLSSGRCASHHFTIRFLSTPQYSILNIHLTTLNVWYLRHDFQNRCPFSSTLPLLLISSLLGYWYWYCPTMMMMMFYII